MRQFDINVKKDVTHLVYFKISDIFRLISLDLLAIGNIIQNLTVFPHDDGIKLKNIKSIHLVSASICTLQF